MHMKSLIGSAAAQRFSDLIQLGTPPAIFKAFFDLYVDGTTVHALALFKEILAVGSANQKRLVSPYLDWTLIQGKQMVRDENHLIRNWIKNVCDVQPNDPSDDQDEMIWWRKWEAPNFIIMKPSRYKPYDAATAWQRNDPETSHRWVNSFVEQYVIHIETRLKKAVGDEALALAKQPAQETGPVSVKTEVQTVSSPPANLPSIAKALQIGTRSPNTARRDARKLKTQAMYAAWKTEYRRQRKARPEMSDVWISQHIAGLAIAKGKSAETIRKHMTK